MDSATANLSLFLYYQKIKQTRYSSRKKTLIYTKRKKESSGSLVLKKNYGQNFFSLLGNHIQFLKLNAITFFSTSLNELIKDTNSIAFIKQLYQVTKIYLDNIFSRRYNLYIDYLRLTTLFAKDLISTKSYLELFSEIFTYLSKRLHGKFFAFFKKTFVSLFKTKESFFNSILFGVKFVIKGRLKGKHRAKSYIFKSGRVSSQSFNKRVEYSLVNASTIYGVYGMRLWICRSFKINKLSLINEKEINSI